MNQLRTYLALVILGVFIFPMSFQPLHVLLHHWHNYDVAHAGCHTECATMDEQDSSWNLTEKEQACLVNDYQFPVQDLPLMMVSWSVIRVIDSPCMQYPGNSPKQQIHSSKTPRAPPHFIC